MKWVRYWERCEGRREAGLRGFSDHHRDVGLNVPYEVPTEGQ